MILCIDCGNTSIKFGVYDKKLIKSFTIKTLKDKSFDEYAITFRAILRDKYEINGAIISSVVPLLTEQLVKAIRSEYNIDPLVVDKNIKTKMPIKIDNPRELGADMLIGAVEAKKEFGYPLIVADLGTATKLYVLDKNGAFIGGVITCGMEVELKALVSSTSQLLETQIVRPHKIIGKNTIESIQSGIIYGQAYMISEFARRIENELGYPLKRVLTGGFSKVIRDQIVCFEYRENLILDGLFEVYLINKE